MNTMREFISKSHLPAKLIRSTVKQIGGWNSFKEEAKDIAELSALAGWHGFTYYVDTVPFAARNRKEILDSLTALADDMGESLLACLTGFNCLKAYSLEEIAEGLYNPRGDCRTMVYNALAWYALEEVARSYDDLSYSDYCD